MVRPNRIEDMGERAVQFINRLTHTGDYNGQPFRLRPFQEALIRTLFGTIRDDGLRKFKRAFWAFGRKSGKSELVGAIIVFLIFGTGLRNQEIYSCSGDRKQAGIVWKSAATMIENDPYLRKLCHIYKGNVKKIVARNGNVFEALSSDAPGKHGYNPSIVLFDEVHVFPNRNLHDTLTTAFGARKDPLSIYITTAGKNKHSLCYELWKHAEAVIEKPELDPQLYPVIYQADPSDDWKSPDTWKKALPGLGDFTSLEFIESECKHAQNLPSYEPSFKQLYLNLWVDDIHRVWITSDNWSACERPIDWTHYEGRDCYGGLDLSAVRDLSAFALIFPNDDGTVAVLPLFWCPGESAREREEMDRAPYMKWARDDYLKMSNRATVDYSVIEQDILELSRRFNIKSIGYDRYNSAMLVDHLESAGLNMLEYGQSYSYMNAPCRQLENLILNQEIHHDGNPVLAWNVTNCVLESKNEIIRPSKDKSSNRIDGAVALIMALGVSMGGEPESENIYEKRGLVFA